MPDKDEAQAIQRAIEEVLLLYWDPIGIKNVPEARSEYESYVGAVYRLLRSKASDRAIAEHLSSIEAQELGLPGTRPELLAPVVDELRKVGVWQRPGDDAA